MSLLGNVAVRQSIHNNLCPGPLTCVKSDLQQVEQMLVTLQLLPLVSTQSFQTFVLLNVHHVRELLLVLLGQFLTVRDHFLFAGTHRLISDSPPATLSSRLFDLTCRRPLTCNVARLRTSRPIFRSIRSRSDSSCRLKRMPLTTSSLIFRSSASSLMSLSPMSRRWRNFLTTDNGGVSACTETQRVRGTGGSSHHRFSLQTDNRRRHPVRGIVC